MNEIERLRRLRAYIPLSKEAVDLWNDIRTFAQYVTALTAVSKKDYDFYKRFIRDFRRRIESLVARLTGVRLLYQPIDPDELKRARIIIIKGKRYKPERIFEPFLALLVDILDAIEVHLEAIYVKVTILRGNLEVRITASCETGGGHQPISIPEIHASTILPITYTLQPFGEYSIEYVDAETGESFYVNKEVDRTIGKAEIHIARELEESFLSYIPFLAHALVIKEGAEHILTHRKAIYPKVEIEGEYRRYQKGKFKIPEFVVGKGNIRDWLE